MSKASARSLYSAKHLLERLLWQVILSDLLASTFKKQQKSFPMHTSHFIYVFVQLF